MGTLADRELSGTSKPLLSHDIRAVLNNIGWLSFDRMLRMGGSLLVGTLVARFLGPSQFGILNLATAIYLLFNTVSNLGLDYLVVRDAALYPDQEHELLGTAFLLKVAASVLTTLSAVLYAWLAHPRESIIVLLVALFSVVSILQGFDVIEYFFQAKTLSRYTVVPKTVIFLLASVARLWAVHVRASLLIFGAIIALEMLLGELSLIFSYLRYELRTVGRWKFRLERGKSLLKESWPLVLASLLVTIYMRMDQILLGFLTSSKVVGYYSAAVRLSEIWYVIPSLICSSVMPKLLTKMVADKKQYYDRLQTLYNYFVLLSVVLAVGTMLLSRVAIYLIFGRAYMAAASVLTVHIWTGVFVFIGVLGGQQLIHEKLVAVELRRALLGAVANLGLNLLLIPRFGGIGSAVATLVAQALASYVADAFSSRTRHLFRMKSYALSGLWLWRREFR